MKIIALGYRFFFFCQVYARVLYASSAQSTVYSACFSSIFLINVRSTFPIGFGYECGSWSRKDHIPSKSSFSPRPFRNCRNALFESVRLIGTEKSSSGGKVLFEMRLASSSVGCSICVCGSYDTFRRPHSATTMDNRSGRTVDFGASASVAILCNELKRW